MQDYIDRLLRCGVPMSEAVMMSRAMLKDFGENALEELIRSMERDAYVARIQS